MTRDAPGSKVPRLLFDRLLLPRGGQRTKLGHFPGGKDPPRESVRAAAMDEVTETGEVKDVYAYACDHRSGCW